MENKVQQEIRVIENSDSNRYVGTLNNYLIEGWQILWCEITPINSIECGDQSSYKAIIVRYGSE